MGYVLSWPHDTDISLVYSFDVEHPLENTHFSERWQFRRDNIEALRNFILK